MRDDIVEAKNSLERACPLMELLPPAVSEDQRYAVGCFALLREVYGKLYNVGIGDGVPKIGAGPDPGAKQEHGSSGDNRSRVKSRKRGGAAADSDVDSGDGPDAPDADAVDKGRRSGSGGDGDDDDDFSSGGRSRRKGRRRRSRTGGASSNSAGSRASDSSSRSSEGSGAGGSRDDNLKLNSPFDVDKRFEDLRSPYEHLRAEVQAQMRKQPQAALPQDASGSPHKEPQPRNPDRDRDRDRDRNRERTREREREKDRERDRDRDLDQPPLELLYREGAGLATATADLDALVQRFVFEDETGRLKLFRMAKDYYEAMTIHMAANPQLINGLGRDLDIVLAYVEVLAQVNEEGFDFISQEIDDFLNTLEDAGYVPDGNFDPDGVDFDDDDDVYDGSPLPDDDDDGGGFLDPDAASNLHVRPDDGGDESDEGGPRRARARGAGRIKPRGGNGASDGGSTRDRDRERDLEKDLNSGSIRDDDDGFKKALGRAAKRLSKDSASAELSRADHNRLMVLHAFDRALSGGFLPGQDGDSAGFLDDYMLDRDLGTIEGAADIIERFRAAGRSAAAKRGGIGDGGRNSMYDFDADLLGPDMGLYDDAGLGRIPPYDSAYYSLTVRGDSIASFVMLSLLIALMGLVVAAMWQESRKRSRATHRGGGGQAASRIRSKVAQGAHVRGGGGTALNASAAAAAAAAAAAGGGTTSAAPASLFAFLCSVFGYVTGIDVGQTAAPGSGGSGSGRDDRATGATDRRRFQGQRDQRAPGHGGRADVASDDRGAAAPAIADKEATFFSELSAVLGAIWHDMTSSVSPPVSRAAAPDTPPNTAAATAKTSGKGGNGKGKAPAATAAQAAPAGSAAAPSAASTVQAATSATANAKNSQSKGPAATTGKASGKQQQQQPPAATRTNQSTPAKAVPAAKAPVIDAPAVTTAAATVAAAAAVPREAPPRPDSSDDDSDSRDDGRSSTDDLSRLALVQQRKGGVGGGSSGAASGLSSQAEVEEAPFVKLVPKSSKSRAKKAAAQGDGFVPAGSSGRAVVGAGEGVVAADETTVEEQRAALQYYESLRTKAAVQAKPTPTPAPAPAPAPVPAPKTAHSSAPLPSSPQPVRNGQNGSPAAHPAGRHPVPGSAQTPPPSAIKAPVAGSAAGGQQLHTKPPAPGPAHPSPTMRPAVPIAEPGTLAPIGGGGATYASILSNHQAGQQSTGSAISYANAAAGRDAQPKALLPANKGGQGPAPTLAPVPSKPLQQPLQQQPKAQDAPSIDVQHGMVAPPSPAGAPQPSAGGFPEGADDLSVAAGAVASDASGAIGDGDSELPLEITMGMGMGGIDLSFAVSPHHESAEDLVNFQFSNLLLEDADDDPEQAAARREMQTAHGHDHATGGGDDMAGGGNAGGSHPHPHPSQVGGYVSYDASMFGPNGSAAAASAALEFTRLQFPPDSHFAQSGLSPNAPTFNPGPGLVGIGVGHGMMGGGAGYDFTGYGAPHSGGAMRSGSADMGHPRGFGGTDVSASGQPFFMQGGGALPPITDLNGSILGGGVPVPMMYGGPQLPQPTMGAGGLFFPPGGLGGPNVIGPPGPGGYGSTGAGFQQYGSSSNTASNIGSNSDGTNGSGSNSNSGSADGGDRSAASGDATVTLVLTAHCTFLPPTVTRTVKVASALFGVGDINHAQVMRRSMANPSMWGATVRVPKAAGNFVYKYVALDTNRQVWEDAGPVRSVSVLQPAVVTEDGAVVDVVELEDSFGSGSLWLGDVDNPLTGL